MEYITHSPEETEALGAEYAKASRQAMSLRSPATSVPARPRILDSEALFEIGFDEYLDGSRIVLIEWSEKRRRRSAGSLQNRPYCLRRCGQRPPHYDWRSDCMKILALESSAVSASVALTEDEKLVAQSFQNCGLTHSRTLLPMVENLLANCGVSLADVDAIAVAHGPGSFTGVRIGVATVKGLALGADKPCLGVSTLEAMAWGARALGGNLCCVMDARAGQVYNALFTVEDGRVRRLCDDRAIKLTELAEEIGEAPYFLVGDGADLCYNTIKENCTGLRLAPAELRFATGFGVAAAALPLFREGKTCSPRSWTPSICVVRRQSASAWRVWHRPNSRQHRTIKLRRFAEIFCILTSFRFHGNTQSITAKPRLVSA